MKNFAILGLASLLLFAIAAGMSVWLQQSKQLVEEKDAKKKDDKDKGGIKDEPKDKPKGDKGADKYPPKEKDDELGTAAALKAQSEALKRREERADKRDARSDLILQDIRTQQEEVDRLRKQVSDEAKTLVEKAAVRDSQAKQDAADIAKLPKAPAGGFAVDKPKPVAAPPDPAERKNIERLAQAFEGMPPEAAGRLLQQHADTGKLDFAARVLLAMKPRVSGQVLAGIPDPTVAAQLIDKMHEIRKPAPALAGGGS